MNFFLYILPGQWATSQLADKLADAGLKHLPAASTLKVRGLQTGPEMCPCTMIADGRCPASELNYKPEAQVWQKSINEKFWIGHWTDRLPTEKDLRRPDLIDGHVADLGETGKWQVPCARKFPTGTCLPEKLVITANGVLLEQRPEFVEFSKRAERLFCQIMRQVGFQLDDGPEELTALEECLIVCEAMGLNYFVGPDEVNVLGLLDTQRLSLIGSYVVDSPAIQASLVKRLGELKKNNASLQQTLNDSADGDSTEPTGQPSASTLLTSEADR